MEIQRVMVALSRAGPDVHLLDYARLVAGMFPQAEFHFVHVLPWPEPELTRSRAPTVTHAQAVREVRQAVMAGFDGCAKFRETVLTGDRVDRLLEYAAESRADLVLVGHRKGRRSLAKRLAMKAPCSVWMAPEGATAQVSGVVVGVDFSEPSAVALSTAAAFARAKGLEECVALHVFSPDTLPESEARTRLGQFAAAWDLHDIGLRLVVEPALTVFLAIEQLRTREKIDLVVLGWRGANSSAAVLLGCEAEQMIMESAMPVLIVKRTGERIEFLETLLDRRLAGRSSDDLGCAAEHAATLS